MPGEFEPHQGCILIWPKRPGSWGYEAKAAGNAFAAVIKAIAQSEKVYVAVTKKTLPIAQEKLFGENKNADIMQQDNIELFFADTDDAWARDVAPTFVKSNEHNTTNSNKEGSDQSSNSASDSDIRAVNWEFNAWGGNVDGLYASWEKDNVFASAFADQFGFDWYDAAPFVLEGGSIHSDGDGTLLTTESCLLSAGRNPNLSRDRLKNSCHVFLESRRYYGFREEFIRMRQMSMLTMCVPFFAQVRWCLRGQTIKMILSMSCHIKAYRILKMCEMQKAASLLFISFQFRIIRYASQKRILTAIHLRKARICEKLESVLQHPMSIFIFQMMRSFCQCLAVKIRKAMSELCSLCSSGIQTER